MEFYMVCHYIYDGYNNTSNDAVVPFPDSFQAMDYLTTFYEDNQDYIWEIDKDGFKILIKREGQYSYDYYYLQKMQMGQEIDW